VESTAERLAEIVEAAEQAASKVIDDAEVEARRRLEDAQSEADRVVAERLESLSDLTDSLVAQSEEIRRHSERLLASLDEVKQLLGDGAIASVSAEPAEPREKKGSGRGSHLSAVAPVEEPPEHPGESSGSAAGARLLATQMAVSGSSREEIATRLRNGFEIEDTTPILDAILGPED
jgi:vacuolar-type H+-ATPase subunit H